MSYSHNPFSLTYNPITDRMEMFPDAKWINVLILNHTRTIVTPLHRQDQADHVRLWAPTHGIVAEGWYKATITFVGSWPNNAEDDYYYYPNNVIILRIHADGTIERQNLCHSDHFGITAESTSQEIAFRITSPNQALLRGIEAASLQLERID